MSYNGVGNTGMHCNDENSYQGVERDKEGRETSKQAGAKIRRKGEVK